MTTIHIPVVKDYILIVDDNTPITELIKRILIGEGEVHVAYNGEEGLECVLKQDFDLIITDMHMPKESGFSFYNKAIEKKPHLKGRFIFMAGDFSNEQIAYFHQHGIEHLIKPSSAKDIRVIAKRVLLLTQTSKEQS